MARKRKQGGKTNNAAIPVMRPDAAGIDSQTCPLLGNKRGRRAKGRVRSILVEYLSALPPRFMTAVDQGLRQVLDLPHLRL